MDGRLECILSHVHAKVLADIGCDHGKVAVYAVLRGLTGKSIAADISEECLKKARALAKEKGAESVEFRVGDGMRVLKENEADNVVIAGMGGREIAKILSEAPAMDAKFILVPHDDAPLLRAYLAKCGYEKSSDKIVRSGGKFYPVIVCKKGGAAYTPALEELLYGTSPADGDCTAYAKQRLAVLERICASIKEGDARREEPARQLEATRALLGRAYESKGRNQNN